MSDEEIQAFDVREFGAIGKLEVDSGASIYTGIAIDISPERVDQAVIIVAANAQFNPIVYAARFVDTLTSPGEPAALSAVSRRAGDHIRHVTEQVCGKVSAPGAFVVGDHALAVRHALEGQGAHVIEWPDFAYTDIIQLDDCAHTAMDAMLDLVVCGTSPGWGRTRADLSMIKRVPAGFRWGGLSRYTWGAGDFTNPNDVNKFHDWYLSAIAFAVALGPED